MSVVFLSLLLIFELILHTAQVNFMLFLNIFKILRISFWTFLGKNCISLCRMVVSCLELPNKGLGLVALKGNPLIQTLIEEQSCWNKVLYKMILIKCNMGLCQGEGLFMCLFWGDLMKNSEPKISCFYICWPGKGFWSGAKGSYSLCFDVERCPRRLVKWRCVSL